MKLPRTTFEFSARTNDHTWRVTWQPSKERIAAAKELLKKYEQQLDLAEEIGSRPLFWMNRRWEDGGALAFPELSRARFLSQLLRLRAAVAAAEGRHRDALADGKMLQTMVSHLSQEGIAVIPDLADGIRRSFIATVMAWTFLHRDQSAYLELLEELITEFQRPDLENAYRTELYLTLRMMEQAQTREGFLSLGFSEEVASRYEFQGGAKSLEVAKAHVVRGFRRWWKSLENYDEERAKSATEEIRQGLALVPALNDYTHYWTPFGDDAPFAKRRSWQTTDVLLQACLAAARAGYPKELDTRDFISPIDGKPIRSRSDGKSV